jgi:hypothetical protein
MLCQFSWQYVTAAVVRLGYHTEWRGMRSHFSDVGGSSDVNLLTYSMEQSPS